MTAVVMALAAAAVAWAPPLDRITPVADQVMLRGELRSSLDGSTFDALTQRDRFPTLPGASGPRLGGLFDPEAGGLRVIEQDSDNHVYRLAADGTVGAACVRAGVPSPCLVPRLQALAFERLVTAAELDASLAGTLGGELLPPPLLSSTATRALGTLGGLAGLLLAAVLGLSLRRARRATTLGQVYVAAAAARRAIRGDATLAAVHQQIEALLVRAEELESARRACLRRLNAINPAALEAKRTQLARAQTPDAAAALAMLATESREADVLALDLASAMAGLERIASALRALPLRTRQHRGTQAVSAGGDPVQALLGELDLRELALLEVGAEPRRG